MRLDWSFLIDVLLSKYYGQYNLVSTIQCHVHPKCTKPWWGEHSVLLYKTARTPCNQSMPPYPHSSRCEHSLLNNCSVYMQVSWGCTINVKQAKLSLPVRHRPNCNYTQPLHAVKLWNLQFLPSNKTVIQ